ncbi:MAG: bifunctional diaminohydroxyphosphoribosylaminopyrimidine deaminase/5-amino-6-(5-phosphoribosylamino)uracil reductase RibD, partial [Desulfofustis sp.]|nr:bifunctional diaminohydroxyphosphoribosylaminopyrimidine deaminase/5-amino-6-(5-phosphoribosylamino)uracil reductase RibD [Desulfofustis sp.]
MRRALAEARKGLGRTAPNPCVGAVIVKDGRIISTGYHRRAGTPHAEIHALRAAGPAARGATMYVTLEPCNHYGRTPPCSQAVADAGIAEVVIGMLDPNPLVDGSGVQYLRNRGIAVVTGVLEEQCRELNRPFLKHVSTSLPWVVMKAGLSLDGRITFRAGSCGSVTGPESLRHVHRLRDRYDAILVGIGTVEIDNPSLTTRLAGRRGRDPVRIILDTTLRIDEQARVVRQQSAAPTMIFCSKEADPEKRERLSSLPGVVIVEAACGDDGRLDLTDVLRLLGAEGITSVLVEGGAVVHGAFLTARLVDRVNLFYAPIFIGAGGISVVEQYQSMPDRGRAIRLTNTSIKRFGEDLLVAGDV